MPSMKTMISDLYQGRSKRFKGPTIASSVDRVISQAHKLDETYTEVSAYFSALAPALTWEAVGPQSDARFYDSAPARLLHFAEGMSIVVDLDRAHRICVSPGYSGCAYSVYYAGNGIFKCVHTARPGPPNYPRPGYVHNADQFVALLDAYALAQHWVLRHRVQTVGTDQVPGCRGTALVTRISYNVVPAAQARTVRLRIDANGNVLSRARWTDAQADPELTAP